MAHTGKGAGQAKRKRGQPMYDKRTMLELLDREGIAYQLVEHVAVFTVDEARRAQIPFAAFGAKNLFLRDDKKRAYYLVCMPDDADVSLKSIQSRIGSRRLSFASAADLKQMLRLVPGAVTPLGALDDGARHVEVVIDQALVDRGSVAVHPCDNTATVLLQTADLIGLLRRHGRQVRVVALQGPPTPVA